MEHGPEQDAERASRPILSPEVRAAVHGTLGRVSPDGIKLLAAKMWRQVLGDDEKPESPTQDEEPTDPLPK